MSLASRRRIGSIASHVAAAETELAVEQVDPATLNIHADGDAPLSDGEIEAFLSDGVRGSTTSLCARATRATRDPPPSARPPPDDWPRSVPRARSTSCCRASWATARTA
jgi:hypothetical protein